MSMRTRFITRIEDQLRACEARLEELENAQKDLPVLHQAAWRERLVALRGLSALARTRLLQVQVAGEDEWLSLRAPLQQAADELQEALGAGIPSCRARPRIRPEHPPDSAPGIQRTLCLHRGVGSPTAAR